MRLQWTVGRGLSTDVRGRFTPAMYASDWRAAFVRGWRRRIAAASTGIFLASVVPALAFGQQFYLETNGAISTVQVLAATAIAGVVQSLVGGQPLLIVGVAEPIVLTYSYLYSFAKGRADLGPGLFLPWASWVCVWAALMIMVLALFNACSYIERFTRFSGELFGGLIVTLFFQQAIRGTVQEFQSPEGAPGPWPLVNGLWSLFLAWGLLLTSLLMRTARSWRFLRPGLRAVVTDYGAVAMVVAWSGLSFAVGGYPGVPVRLSTPNTWQVTQPWLVAQDMHRVPGQYVAGALIPAAVIALLFFFDHSVSSQLAQQVEFNLRKPSAYHYDFMLLGFMTLLCGLIGLPPVNGVLPQSPMHTKALSVVVSKRRQPPQRCHAASAGQAGPQQEQRRQQQQAAHVQQQQQRSRKPGLVASNSRQALVGASVSASSQADLASPAAGSGVDADTALESAFAPAAQPAQAPDEDQGAEGLVVQLEVAEQRLSNLLQSLAVGVGLAATPALRQIPSAVLWGYFAFMACESLPGSQFWERLLLLLTDPSRRAALLEAEHAPYLETVPFRVVAAFTLLQLACMLGVYGLTWAGVAGILFPIPIMLCVPLRQYVLPRWFRPEHLQELDALHTEVADPLPHDLALAGAEQQGLARDEPSTGQEDELLPLPEEEAVGLHVVRHIARQSVLRRCAAAEALPRRSAHELARLSFPPPHAHAVSSPRRRSLTLPGTGGLDGAV